MCMLIAVGGKEMACEGCMVVMTSNWCNSSVGRSNRENA